MPITICLQQVAFGKVTVFLLRGIRSKPIAISVNIYIRIVHCIWFVLHLNTTNRCARKNPTPPSWFREVQRIITSIPLFSLIPPKNTEIHRTEESHTPIALRHRENIGRMGSLRVFWQISVIAVFPLKTGIWCSLGSIPKTHLTILIGIRGFGWFFWLGSEVTQRICRGNNCVICVYYSLVFRHRL